MSDGNSTINFGERKPLTRRSNRIRRERQSIAQAFGSYGAVRVKNPRIRMFYEPRDTYDFIFDEEKANELQEEE